MQALESSNEKNTSPVSHFSHVHPRFLDSQPRHPSYVEAHHSHRSCDFLFSPLGRHVMLLLSTNSRLGRFNPIEKVLVQIGSSPTKVGLPINNFESTTKLMSRVKTYRFTINGCRFATIWCSPGKYCSKFAIHSKGQLCVHEKAMYHVVLVGG